VTSANRNLFYIYSNAPHRLSTRKTKTVSLATILARDKLDQLKGYLVTYLKEETKEDEGMIWEEVSKSKVGLPCFFIIILFERKKTNQPNE